MGIVKYDDAATNYNSPITAFNGVSSMQSVLNRGADTILNIGAWNNSSAAPDLNQALIDNEVITEGIVTTLTAGTRNSLLNRGASGRIYIGAFQHPDPLADLNQALIDNIGAIAETVTLTNTPTVYPFNSLMNRGAAENANHQQKLEIGAWQTPFPRVAGIMPGIPTPPVIAGIRELFIASNPVLFDMLIDDLTEIISYKIQVIAGNANDTYPDDFIKFNFYANHVLLTTWDNPADIILTRHGQENFYINVNGFGFLKKLSVRGFKIKNSTPGFVSRYQLIILG